MLRNKILCVVYSLIALMSVLTFFNVRGSASLDLDNKFVVSYLPNTTGIAVYEPKTSNTMKCNLTTVNMIISNMISKDYFYISKDRSEGNLLDIIITNDVEEYRILYNRRTRDYMCLSNPFLKNYIPATYINE